MAENSNVPSECVEAILSHLLNALSAANPTLHTPFLEVEDTGDDVFKCSFIIKFSSPERSVDFEQDSNPVNGSEAHSGGPRTN
jgi:hypothetical protein